MGKLARLRSMPTPEIGYRLRERLRIEAERAQVVLGSASQERLALAWPQSSCLRYLREIFATSFYTAPAERDNILSSVEKDFPEWQKRAAREAEDLCAHRVELLGYG